jgi:uncharacterized membrane protein YeaQ/YmgE (transglycosylase-associated protein family)
MNRRGQNAARIPLALALCSWCAIDAYGWSGGSLALQSIRQEEEALSFVAWIVLGLTAGFIGSQLVNRTGKGILPDILLGVVGALAGGWLYYTFGPPSVTGFNLSSYFAVIGSLIVLLTYYFLRRV